jgi:UDP-glucuronate decarboxylase
MSSDSIKRMDKILVTGCAGLIGFHLSQVLVKNGHRVIGIDNYYTGQKKNIELLQNHNNFEFIEHDVNQPYDVNVDAIVNLACPASPVHYQRDPIYTMLTNINGAHNGLQLAKELNIPILQASTSEIYGNPAIHPQVESYWGNVNPIGIRSCYDEGKRAAETLFADFRRNHFVNSKIMRIFNTYGPNMAMNDGRVVSNFIIQALQGQEITMFGAGDQTRSFCYVGDLVDGMYKFLKTDFEKSGPLNFGNPTETTMLELAKTIIKLTNSPSKIVHKPLPQDDPDRRRPDLSETIESIGWEPSTSLVDGLTQTIQYFKNEIR